MTTRTGHAAQVREQSAARLAERGCLLTRMAGASAISRASTRKDGSDLTFLAVGRSGLLAVDGDGTRPVTFDVLQSVLTSTGRMPVPVDRHAVAAMVRVAEQGGRAHSHVAREIGVLHRLPVSTRMFTLTDALDRKLWAPTGMDRGSLTGWSRVLGHGGGFDVRAGQAMASLVLDTSANQPRQRGIVKVVQDMEDVLTRTAGRPGAMAAASLFRLAGSLGEAWAAYQRIDALLHRAYLARGEVVAVSNVRWDRGQAIGDLSTPCKLKPREVMAFTVGDDSDDFTLRLASLGFDGGLIGVFSTTGTGRSRRGPGRAEQARRARLSRLVEQAVPFYVTSTPYLAARSGGVDPRWFTPGPLAPVDGPALPVDIAIAGGPVGD